MQVKTRIAVDLTLANTGARVNAVQGDVNTRYVDVILMADGNPWTPPEGVQAAIAYRQPDGTKGLYDQLADGTPAISISENVATVILAPHMLAVPGTVNASVVFHDDQLNSLTTFPFFVSVAQNQYAGAQEAEDYIRLQWLEDKLDEYVAILETGRVDEEIVQRFVSTYLEENPPAQGPQGEKGDTGPQGPAGADGYTPVRGTDYWTEEDKAQIVSDVLAELPAWEGGSY